MQPNITLIDMAGVGKSFIGKILSDRLSIDLIETDDLISDEAKRNSSDKELLPDQVSRVFKFTIFYPINTASQYIPEASWSR